MLASPALCLDRRTLTSKCIDVLKDYRHEFFTTLDPSKVKNNCDNVANSTNMENADDTNQIRHTKSESNTANVVVDKSTGKLIETNFQKW